MDRPELASLDLVLKKKWQVIGSLSLELRTFTMYGHHLREMLGSEWSTNLEISKFHVLTLCFFSEYSFHINLKFRFLMIFGYCFSI